MLTAMHSKDGACSLLLPARALPLPPPPVDDDGDDVV